MDFSNSDTFRKKEKWKSRFRNKVAECERIAFKKKQIKRQASKNLEAVITLRQTIKEASEVIQEMHETFYSSRQDGSVKRGRKKKRKIKELYYKSKDFLHNQCGVPTLQDHLRKLGVLV